MAPVGPGFAAAFRVTGWDGAAARRYRVLWGGHAEEQAFEGTVAADPAGDGELRVGLLDCTIHSYRPLNGQRRPRPPPGSDPLGLYTGRNLYFPYAELVADWAGASRTCWPPWATSTTSTGPPPASRAPSPSWTCSTAGTCGCGRSAT